METKICSKCKAEKPVSEFRFRNKAQGIYHSQCKDCEKQRDKIHYRESQNRRIAVRETANFQRNRNLNLVDNAKINGCKKCGEKRMYVLDFHHRNPQEKDDTINHMIKSSSVERIAEEIEKCDVLCSNCHREFHFLEKAISLTYEEYINGWVAQSVVAAD